MAKALILATLLVGLARVAGAQPAHDAAPSHFGDAVVADIPVVDSRADATRARLELSELGDFLKQAASERVVRRWLDPASFRIASVRFAARANPGLPGIRRKMNRTFLPIPMLGWQRHSSLVTARGFVAICPSIVIGRRVTWAPDLVRGGRTIGIAVQMQLWLDDPPTPASAATPSQAPARIVSTVRAYFDGNGR